MKLSRKIRLQLQVQKLVFVTLLLTAVSLLGWLSNQHALQFDWTSNQRNSLSESSVDLLQTLDQPVQVTVYVQDDETVHAAIEEILQRYQRVKQDFNYRLVNPDIDFETAQQDGVERYGQIIVKYNNNKETISSLSEQTISSALLRLSRSAARKLVFIKGHGERSISDDSNTSYSKLIAELANKGFVSEAHNLIAAELPQNTSVLVIAAPDKPLLEGEVEHIMRHLEQGGNLLWMMEPGELQGLDQLASLLGIRFMDGIVVDNNTNLRNTLRIQHPAMIPVLDYHAHPVTLDIEYNTLFPVSRGVEQVDKQFGGTIIAKSLPRSWSEASGLGTDIVYEPENGDTEGPIGIAIALERAIDGDSEADKATQRIIVTGDSDFIANSYIGIGANLSLGLNMFNWLAGDDDLIAVESRNAPDTQLQLDDTEVLLIGIGYFIVIPAGLMLAGVVIWLRRRNR